MAHKRILYGLAAWISILSFLGFPTSWKKVLFLISGLAIIFVVYQSKSTATPKKNESRAFTENAGL